MRRFILFTLVAVFAGLVATTGCQKKSEPASPAATAAPAAPTTAPAAVPAAAAPAPTAPVAAAAPGEIGIAECDDYIRKWESCLATKITGDAKEQTKVALEATREGWKRMAASPESRVHLAGACRDASELAVMQVAAYGCTW